MKYGEVKLYNGQIVNVHWDDGDGVVPAEEYKKVDMYGYLWDYKKIESLKKEFEMMQQDIQYGFAVSVVNEAISLITEAYYKAQTIFDEPHEPFNLKWEMPTNTSNNKFTAEELQKGLEFFKNKMSAIDAADLNKRFSRALKNNDLTMSQVKLGNKEYTIWWYLDLNEGTPEWAYTLDGKELNIRHTAEDTIFSWKRKRGMK